MPAIARLLLLLAFSTSALAQEAMQSVRPGDELKVEGARGYWFYKEPVKDLPLAVEPTPEAAPSKENPKKTNPCLSVATWTANCGFVNPKNSFEFQAKQRDELMQQMALNPDSAKAVESFQRYNKWVVEQGVKAAQMWQYNMVQNPDLDPSVAAPISAVGLALVSSANNASAVEIWRVIAESGGFLVMFTRDDCPYCHSSLPLVARVSTETGIPAYVAPLDGKCFKDVPAEACLPGDVSYASGVALQATLVPAVFLYVPDQTWIRVATGVVTSETMKSRISNFFAAYRSGVAKGLASESGSPAVSFGGQAGIQQGAKGTAEGVRMPTEAEIKDLLLR